MGEAKNDPEWRSRERLEVFDAAKEFYRLGNRAVESYGREFPLRLADLEGAAKNFKDLDMEEVKSSTLQAYREGVYPVTNKFLIAFNNCRRVCRKLEESFKGMVALAVKFPDLLKDDSFAAEIREVELRVEDAFGKLKEYEALMPDAEVVVDGWPETGYNPLKAVYQDFVQEPIGFVWKEFVGEKSALNKLASEARRDIEGTVYDFLVADTDGVTEQLKEAGDTAGKIGGKVVKKAIKKATDVLGLDDN